MNIRVKDEDLAIMKFAIGQPVRRVEDASLLQGRGQYTDDVNRPGQVYCAMVRSQQAHGILRGIDIEAARAMPGVIAIYTGADLAIAGYGAAAPPWQSRRVLRWPQTGCALSAIRWRA